MKAYLMNRAEDFPMDLALPPNEADLTQDLELTTLYAAMSRGDEFLHEVARRALQSSLLDADTVRYRQEVLRDCIAHPEVLRELYGIAVEAVLGEKKFYRSIFRYPQTALNRAVSVLEMFVGLLKRLRYVAALNAADFRSEGFTRLFAMVAAELDDEYFHLIDHHLKELRFRGGVLVSAELGTGLKGRRFVLRTPNADDRAWFARLTSRGPQTYTYTIADRDESGAKTQSLLRDRGLNHVANALTQSTDHILSFFQMLRSELGFYVGALNLHELLEAKGDPTCYPDPAPVQPPGLQCRGLYDVCLTLTVDRRVVGQDVDAVDTRLVMVTGANQGGKSTFLRSVGLAQLMMQAGMFVPADSFSASMCRGVFTHYRREEDAAMDHGKFDEELARMSTVTDHIRAGSLLLCNESFAATNEREGSQVAREVTRAMLESGVRVVFVTHLYDLAHGLYATHGEHTLFLRAERRHDGTRTFRLTRGEPLPTSFGADVYRTVFGHPLEEPQGESGSDLAAGAGSV